MATTVFLSVGTTFNPQQEAFVKAVEEFALTKGLRTVTVGRNYYPDKPLLGVREKIKQSAGAIVIALERIRIENGVEKPESQDQSTLSNISVATPWNQVEAAFAYAMGLPLLVMKEKQVKSEGLLDGRYDWYVQEIDVGPGFVTSPEFLARFETWSRRVRWRALHRGWLPI
jgi:hypothetical protein